MNKKVIKDMSLDFVKNGALTIGVFTGLALGLALFNYICSLPSVKGIIPTVSEFFANLSFGSLLVVAGVLILIVFFMVGVMIMDEYDNRVQEEGGDHDGGR